MVTLSPTCLPESSVTFESGVGEGDVVLDKKNILPLLPGVFRLSCAAGGGSCLLASTGVSVLLFFPAGFPAECKRVWINAAKLEGFLMKASSHTTFLGLLLPIPHSEC